MNISNKDFINPLTDLPESLDIIALVEDDEHLYVCNHSGNTTVIHISANGHWVGKNEMTTPLTKALGDVIEHHFA